MLHASLACLRLSANLKLHLNCRPFHPHSRRRESSSRHRSWRCDMSFTPCQIEAIYVTRRYVVKPGRRSAVRDDLPCCSPGHVSPGATWAGLNTCSGRFRSGKMPLHILKRGIVKNITRRFGTMSSFFLFFHKINEFVGQDMHTGIPDFLVLDHIAWAAWPPNVCWPRVPGPGMKLSCRRVCPWETNLFSSAGARLPRRVSWNTILNKYPR